MTYIKIPQSYGVVLGNWILHANNIYPDVVTPPLQQQLSKEDLLVLKIYIHMEVNYTNLRPKIGITEDSI